MAELDEGYLGVDPGSKAELTRGFAGARALRSGGSTTAQGCGGSAEQDVLLGFAGRRCDVGMGFLEVRAGALKKARVRGSSACGPNRITARIAVVQVRERGKREERHDGWGRLVSGGSSASDAGQARAEGGTGVLVLRACWAARG